MKKRTIWTFNKIAKKALKYKTRYEFQSGDENAYAAARARDILDTVCQHMEKRFTSWSFDLLLEEARKYKTRNEFKTKNECAYQSARTRGVLDKVCIHMEKAHKNWTNDNIQKEAFKYSTRSSFQKNSQYAYILSIKKGILETVCSHMTRKTDSKVASDNNIIYLWNIKDTNVYKIGVTSKKRGYARINEVSRKHNIEAVVLAYVKVDDAFSIENELHNTFNGGQDIITKGDGVTEFKTLEYYEVVEALDYIKQYMIEGKLTYPKYING